MTKLRKASGVTLLEIMLVLAVAAMVIVMSIRYYKNASNNENANAMLAQFNAIFAAADQLAAGAGGSYASVSQANLIAVLGATNMTTPFGQSYTITPTATTVTVTTTAAVPQAVCATLVTGLATNSKVVPTPASAGACTAVIVSALYTPAA